MVRPIPGIMLLVTLLGGCVFTLDTVILDPVAMPELAGVWRSSDGDSFRVTAVDGPGLLIVPLEDPAAVSVHATIGRLGEHLVVEYWPAIGSRTETWPVGRILLSMTLRGEEVILRSFDVDSIRRALSDRTLDLPYLVHDGDNIVLGGTSEETAAALDRYTRPSRFTSDSVVWRRVDRQ